MLATSIAALTIATTIPRPAHALGGLYTMIGIGYGKFNGDKLIMEESTAGNDLPLIGEGCCAKGGPALQLRIGYSLFGFAGEFGLIGNAWDLGANTGGGGIIGGGFRFFPLDILSLGGMDMSDFPIDFGVGVLLGYALAGKEFAYRGFGVDLDAHVDYKLASFMSVGLKVDLGIPAFGDFVYTDFKNDLGRCLDSNGDQVTTGDDFGRVKKSMSQCNGKGPGATFLSPQLTFTFHFDVFE